MYTWAVSTTHLVCSDSIVQGLCRTGKMLCCEHDGIRPHMILLGKALSGGGE